MAEAILTQYNRDNSINISHFADVGGFLCDACLFMPPIIKCQGHYVMAYASGSIDLIFLWLIGGDYRKVPFDDQLHRSSKMATMATILDFGFRRLQDKMPGSVDPIFMWLFGGD
jgi:hypothetical protein